MNPGRRSRQGMSAILVVLGLLSLLGVFGAFQMQLSERSRLGIHRVQLSALARLQARSALQEIRAKLAREANQPGSPLFRFLREKIDQPGESLSLTSFLPKTYRPVAPRWGRGEEDAPARLTPRVLSAEAEIRGTRSSLDVAGSEEWVGILTLRAHSEVQDGGLKVGRELEENYELRSLLLGPPRPFDQVGLYFGRAQALLDAPEVNRRRQAYLEAQVRILSKLESLSPPDLGEAEKARLTEILSGLLPPEEVARRTPELAEEEAVLWGPYHTGDFYLRDLDLVEVLSEIEGNVTQAEAALTSASSGKAFVDAVYTLIDHHSRSLNRIWDYQRMFHWVPRDSAKFQGTLAPYLARLSPRYFRDRAHLQIHPQDPVLERWLDGKARLEGVLDLTRWKAPLTLAGDLRGRVLLLVGPGGIHLQDVNPISSRAGDRITVVSLGGPVSIQGESHAAVLMLESKEGAKDPGRIWIPAGSKLVGKLIAPLSEAGDLELDGVFRDDPLWMAAFPPEKTLDKPFRGDYAFAVDPNPLFSRGWAR